MVVRQTININEPWEKILLAVVVLILLWFLRDIIAMLILSLTVAAAINPLVSFLTSKRWPRLGAVIFIYLALLVVIGVTLFFLIPSIINQTQGIVEKLPEFYDRFLGLFRSVENLLERSRVSVAPEQFVSQFNEIIGRWLSGILLSAFGFFGALSSLIIILVVSFYLVVREEGIEDFLRTITPLRHEEYVLDLWRRVHRKIGRWFQGQLLLGVIVGSLTYFGLRIFNMPFALALAVIAGVLELVPFLGPILAAIPAVILGFLQSPTLGFMILLLYLFIQQLENHAIVPALTRKLVGLSPVIVILALITGGSLGGIIGVLIAIPITVTIVEILDDFAASKRNDRKSQEV
ncbi:AI-2E family transporter [Candidatus Parcubacteria bacterium]|nr:MAG: AI-2E family transporter [Candidatus Parcubacteria bacterium]